MATGKHLLSAALCGLFVATSAGATETYVGVKTDQNGAVQDFQVDLTGAHLSAASRNQGLVGYQVDAISTANKVFDAARSAESELATGRLATVASATFGAQISGPEVPVGLNVLSSRATAWMGDTFTLALGDGSPFSSVGGGTVSFSFDVTGEMTFSGPFVMDEGYSRLSSSFFFGAYRSGALDLWRQYDTAVQTLDFNAANSLYAQIQSLEITTSNALFLDAVTAQREDYLASLPPVDVYVADSVTPTTIEVAFDAPDTFEWLVIMHSEAELDASLINTSASADFGHTLLAGFNAGDGVVAYSSSGLFPGTAPLPAVPEPAAFWMFIVGAGLLGVVVRRRAVA